MEQAVQRINGQTQIRLPCSYNFHLSALGWAFRTHVHSAASTGFLLSKMLPGQFCATHSCWDLLVGFQWFRHLVDGSVWTKRHCLLKEPTFVTVQLPQIHSLLWELDRLVAEICLGDDSNLILLDHRHFEVSDLWCIWIALHQTWLDFTALIVKLCWSQQHLETVPAHILLAQQTISRVALVYQLQSPNKQVAWLRCFANRLRDLRELAFFQFFSTFCSG